MAGVEGKLYLEPDIIFPITIIPQYSPESEWSGAGMRLKDKIVQVIFLPPTSRGSIEFV